jgi:hypothetical protein
VDGKVERPFDIQRQLRHEPIITSIFRLQDRGLGPFLTNSAPDTAPVVFLSSVILSSLVLLYVRNHGRLHSHAASGEQSDRTLSTIIYF